MAEEEERSEEFPEPPEPRTIEAWSEYYRELRREGTTIDPMLSMVVGLAERGTASLGLTVHLGGLIVSGDLCSTADWMRGVADGFRGTNEGGRVFAAALEEGADRTAEDKQGDDEHFPWRGPHYLHMRAARAWSPAGGPIPEIGAMWRCRLSAVDGFLFGVVGRD